MNIEQLYEIFNNCKAVSTDSRVAQGVFFGLKGENFDGSLFGEQALKNGAVFAVTENALEKLQELAAFHRQHLKCPIVAITGTNGKTTTKELIVKVLQTKYNVGFTKGNFNNHIGVPLTLLDFDEKTQIGVVEMGANHVGEIEALCKIAKPNFGIITNVGVAHLEGFGSFENIVKTKGELFDFLAQNNGEALFNGDDEALVKMINYRSGLKSVEYKNELKIVEANDGKLNFSYNGVVYRTKMVGGYNLLNVQAAISVGRNFGVDDESALRAVCEYEPTNNRSQVVVTTRNRVILDAYNANPSSMKIALENLKNIEHPYKVVILGDMKELGGMAEEMHEQIAKIAHDNVAQEVILVGSEFKKIAPTCFDSVDQIESIVKQINDACVLVKGSRSMKMEKIVEWL